MMVPAPARLVLATPGVPSSPTRSRVWQARIGASSSSASTTSSSASTPLRLPRPRHRRVLLCILGSGKTGVCVRPRRAPSSGKTMAAPRPRRLGLHRLRHRHPQRLPRRVSVILLARYAHAASRAATSTPASPTTTSTTATHRTATSTMAPPHALGSLDIGTRATTSLEHHQLPLQSKLPRCDTVHDVPARTAGGCQPTGCYFGLSPV